MNRLLTTTVLPKSADRWVALVAGGGVLAAATAVTALMVPDLSPVRAFVVGVGLGVAWLALAGVLVPAFRRPAAANILP